MQVALFVVLHALGNRQDRQFGIDDLQHVLTEPVHAERAHAAHHQIGALERFLHLFELIVFVAFRKPALHGQMLAGGARMIDDLTVERSADKADFVAVMRGGDADGAAHHARADDCNNAHFIILLKTYECS